MKKRKRKKKKNKPVKARNPYAILARMRSAGPMKDRRQDPVLLTDDLNQDSEFNDIEE